MKTCIKCGEEKDVSEFHTGRNQCKVCRNAYARKYKKSEKGRAIQLKAHRTYRSTKKGRATCRKAQSNYGKNPIKRIKIKLLQRLRSFLKGCDSKLNRETMGCTLAFFRAHYESKFKPGMTWENYGEWENDHIKEMKTFDLENEETWKACMHWSNLQPQWRELNIKNIH